jgi:hypothetical protein
VQWPKTLTESQETQEDYQARVHLDKMVLLGVRQGGWTARAVAKHTQAKDRKRLQAAKGKSEQASDRPNERDNLIFFQGMIKRQDCC